MHISLAARRPLGYGRRAISGRMSTSFHKLIRSRPYCFQNCRGAGSGDEAGDDVQAAVPGVVAVIGISAICRDIEGVCGFN